MKQVSIYKLLNDGSQRIVAVCKLQNGREAVCEGDGPVVQKLTNTGIKNYKEKSGTKLLPKDGITFLEQLKFNFQSGYLMATDVEDK